MLSLSYTEFQKKQFSERTIWIRKDRDQLQNLIKWISLRIAYGLFRLKVPANLFTVLAYGVVIAGFILLSTARTGERIWPLVGAAAICFHVFCDFVDGAIAKGRDASTPVGALLDDLGCDSDRMAMLVLLGIFSEQIPILLANTFAAGIFVFFVTPALKEMPQGGWVGFICRMYNYKYSFLSVRLMLGVLPIFLGVVIYCQWNLVFISQLISCFYMGAAVIWLLISIPKYSNSSV